MSLPKTPISVTLKKLVSAYLTAAQKIPLPPIPTIPGAPHGQTNVPGQGQKP
jgi:hypothetical protein